MAATASYGSTPISGRYVGLAWAIGIHALLLFLLLSGIFQKTVERVLNKPLEAVVLQQVELPPLAPQPPPPKPVVNEPRPAAPAVQRTVAAQPEAMPAPAPGEAPAKVERAAEPAVMAAPATPVVHAAAAEPVHKAVNSASAEADYAARLKALLNASKRYPTGRQASQQRPQGVVKLWFSLNRNGGLVDVGLLEAADSNLLNDAAVSTVRRAVFPAFAAELWPGQEQHRFTVDIDFLPPG